MYTYLEHGTFLMAKILENSYHEAYMHGFQRTFLYTQYKSLLYICIQHNCYFFNFQCMEALVSVHKFNIFWNYPNLYCRYGIHISVLRFIPHFMKFIENDRNFKWPMSDET